MTTRNRPVAFVFGPVVAHEAKGVTIQRTIGGDRLVLLDPFLLLDHVTIAPESGESEIGFNRHPHRGIETLSYVLRGRVTHKDSIGNEGQVSTGGSQWMTAGNGIWHEEYLAPDETGQGEFIQLWMNLPQAQKRVAPRYVGAEPDAVPTVALADGATGRVVSGTLGGATGPFVGITTDPLIVEVRIEAGASVSLPTDPSATAFFYVTSGSVRAGEEWATNPKLIVFGSGDSVQLTASESGATGLFVVARPLGEPVMQFRSFVMNTADDIRETLAMIEAGTLGNGQAG